MFLNAYFLALPTRNFVKQVNFSKFRNVYWLYSFRVMLSFHPSAAFINNCLDSSLTWNFPDKLIDLFLSFTAGPSPRTHYHVFEMLAATPTLFDEIPFLVFPNFYLLFPLSPSSFSLSRSCEAIATSSGTRQPVAFC